jgi:hypothetical protein
MITHSPNPGYTEWLKDVLRREYPFRPVHERYSYCNDGWILLSDALRLLTGTNFSAAMDALLFRPLGMDASSFIPDKPAITNRLAGCYSHEGELMPPEYMNALGSGSMYSSARDLGRYIRMMLAGGHFEGRPILSSNALAAMTAPQGADLPLNIEDWPQGLGWDTVSDYRLRYAGTFFWKNGATYMNRAMLVLSRDCGLGVAVLQNSPVPFCDNLAIELLRHAILDKFGTPWPTNAYTPDFSPVTNRPQSELDALAGLYVDTPGYNKVEAGPGFLTLTLAAHESEPAVRSNLVPRANGWFSSATSQVAQFAFTNLAGHDMLVVHTADGPFPIRASLGERYIPVPLSAAWSNRLERTFRMVDAHPDDYLWDLGARMTLRLWSRDGALLTDWDGGVSVQEPVSDTLSFQRGLHYRLGGALHAYTSNGVDYLWHSGFLFMDQAAIPSLTLPAFTNGAIPRANGTCWFWFPAETGRTYLAALPGADQPFHLRITHTAGPVLASATNSALRWTCEEDGDYLLAVSAVTPFDYTLRLGTVPAAHDFDGDSRSDLAVQNQASGAWYIRTLAGTVLTWGDAFGGSGLRPIPADFDGDGKTDLAVYDEPGGLWYARSLAGGITLWAAAWGGPRLTPVRGDYDGDGRADLAVYSEPAGAWFIRASHGAVLAWALPFGGPQLMPVPGDYDGDGADDLAVYSVTTGLWYVRTARREILQFALPWGGPGLAPVPGDYDGDGLADFAVTGNGAWFIRSAQGNTLAWGLPWGGQGLAPICGDYDGDGRSDPAVYAQSTGAWYVYSLVRGVLLWAEPFGGAGAVIPGADVPLTCVAHGNVVTYDCCWTDEFTIHDPSARLR